MKKLLILCALFFALSAAFAHNRASLERRVQEKVAAKQSVLYTVVERELAEYYGREDFSDPQHQTGWFRVDDFLKWLKKSAPELEQIYDSTTLIRFSQQEKDSWPTQKMWITLGARYIASVYNIEADFSQLDMVNCSFGYCVYLHQGNLKMLVDPSRNMIIPVWINMGMHEMTHMFPYLVNNKSTVLIESAAFYSQYNYGLPVKATDMKSFSEGIRDIRLTYAIKGDFLQAKEYNEAISGILLNSTLTKEDVLKMYPGRFNHVPVWQVVANLIALRDGNYWERGIGWEPRESELNTWNFTQKDINRCKQNPEKVFYLGPYRDTFLQKDGSLFAGFSRNSDKVEFFPGHKGIDQTEYLRLLLGNNAPALYGFYDSLINNLPDEVVKEVRRLWPTQTDYMFSNTNNKDIGWEKFGKPYSAQITQAVIKALKESGAPPPPPIPEGYL